MSTDTATTPEGEADVVPVQELVILDYPTMSVVQLEKHLDQARKDHNELLGKLADQYDDLTTMMATLKSQSLWTAEIVIHSGEGKRKMVFTAPEPFGPQAALVVIQDLVVQAMAEISKSMKQWGTASGERGAVEQQIQREREAFYKLESKAKHALTEARGRETASAARRIDVAKHDTSRPVTVPTMRERIAGWGSGG